MSIDKYRAGYERGKLDIEKTRNQTLGDIPERVVKAIVSAPVEAVKELFRSADEDRGHRDALNNRDFKP